MYDICIIGGGPAGLTAALYSARAGRSTVIVEEKFYGGQMAETSVIENMPGSPDAAGWELTMRFAQQVTDMQVEAVYEKASQLSPGPDHTEITTDSGRKISARRVILAMGVRRRHLGVPGEDRLTGHGVGFCAVCDGAFFRDRDVAVVGGGNTALEDALYLSGICRRVYLLVRGAQFRGQETLAQRVAQRKTSRFSWKLRSPRFWGMTPSAASASAGRISRRPFPSPVSLWPLGCARRTPCTGIF